ncbi:MAG TPA: sporulation protein YqfD, partial [Bacillota bacterium]|nr:sporulation protein YqfD [Bacillota bacterium]
MNLQRLWSWLTGFLVLKLNGDSLEKFINMAASRGIMMWDIQRLKGQSMVVRVRLSSLRPLRHIKRRSGVRFRVLEKRGLPFYFWQMKRRKALTMGAMLFIATLYILSSFVWFVDISGTKKVSRESVLISLAELGVKPGVWRYGLDLKGTEKLL